MLDAEEEEEEEEGGRPNEAKPANGRDGCRCCAEVADDGGGNDDRKEEPNMVVGLTRVPIYVHTVSP